MDHIEAIYYLHLYFVFYKKKVLDTTGYGFMSEIILKKASNINICSKKICSEIKKEKEKGKHVKYSQEL